MPPDIRFGIEEEFFLIDLDSRDIVRRPPAAFVRDCRRALGERLSSELLQCQLETTTPVLSSSAEARRHLTTSRGELIAIAERYDIGLVAAGTHPLAQWRGQLGSRAAGDIGLLETRVRGRMRDALRRFGRGKPVICPLITVLDGSYLQSGSAAASSGRGRRKK